MTARGQIALTSLATRRSGNQSAGKHPTTNIQRRTSNRVRRAAALGVGRSMLDGGRFGADESSRKRKISSDSKLVWSISFQPQNFGRVASSTLARPVSQLTRMKWFV